MNLQFDPLFIITTYSHFFKVTRCTPQGKGFIDHFLTKFIHKSFKQQYQISNNPYRKKGPEPEEKVYAFVTKDRMEYRFHIGQLQLLKDYLTTRGYDDSFYRIQHGNVPIPESFNARIRDGWALRDKQPDVVEFLLANKQGDVDARLVTMGTGTGKGLTSIWSTCERKRRTAVIILPTYMEKWCTELKQVTTATDKDIMMVQGSDSIRGLVELGKTRQYKSDYLIISITTWMNFIKAYGEDPRHCVEEEFGCKPEELFELLGIGTVIYDEIHQHLHGVFRSLCFMNVELCIGLSATFLSKDPFIDMMQRIMFPREFRFEGVRMKKYVRAYGISYTIRSDRMKLIRTTERGQTMYSQTAFEKSIMKNTALRGQYFELVKEVIENGFMDHQYKPGHKCIIFCRTIAMCTAIVEYLRQKYPRLDIRRYTQGDPFENVIDADIRVTTQQSAGTAVDIPGLVTNITLDNMRSAVSNLQCLGRLREPKDGSMARYFSVFCENIKKHSEYHFERKDLFADRVATFREFKSNITL